MRVGGNLEAKSGTSKSSKKVDPFYDSSRYRSFIIDRDRALDQMLINAQIDVSNILHEGLTRILEICAFHYGLIPKEAFFTQTAKRALQNINNIIDAINTDLAQKITIRIMLLRRNAYTLSAAGETEAIARAEDKYKQIRIEKQQLDTISFSKINEKQDLYERVLLALSRIKRRVLDAIETSRVMEEDKNDMLKRVERAFPKSKFYKRPKRTLKPLKEADKKEKEDFLSGTFVSDQEWEETLKNYFESPKIPEERFYNEEPTYYGGTPEGFAKYNWEIEQDMTNDFVEKVRQGQVDAAVENGIKDFVWVAVIDDKTDDCCLWRDGLTTSEIEGELRGKHANDECDATVPPAHFNCRCTLAPVGELPERVESNVGDFEEWLKSE